MSVTDDVKAQLDIVSFIQNYVPLQKAGRNYKALCPFHSEKTPSFVVFPDSQNWRCFGACNEGGDIFSFVMKREGWDFPEALRYLAELAGIELTPVTPQQEENRERAEYLRALMGETAQFFHRQLLNAPNAGHARAYVEQRGLTLETAERFLIGYAPHSWDATMNMLIEQGYTHDDMVGAGMLVVKEDGSAYDRFRNRLTIAIRDARGYVVGLGARALAKDDQPKYLNSPQSEIFDKSSLLFGLSDARRSIRESETAVIVEGYMDVMQAHQGGFTNVVAQMGTALTEPQLKTLARYASRLVLALDPDTAGQMATDRGREVIERVSKAAAEQVGEEGMWGFDAAERDYRARLTTEFDARGYLRYESRMGFDIRVAVLPEGYDPDDLIREDPAAWEDLIAGAVPVVEHAIRQAVEGQALDDPKVKSRIAAEIIPLIEDVADPVERSHYQQRLARLLRVAESALFTRSTEKSRPARATPPPPPNFDDGPLPGEAPRTATSLLTSPTRSRESFCLAALIQYPRMLYRINRIMAEYLAPEQVAGTLPDEMAPALASTTDPLAWQVLPADFAQPEHQMIFRAWQEALDQDAMDALAYLRQSLDDLTGTLVEDWLAQPLYGLARDVQPDAAELPVDRVLEEVTFALLELRSRRIVGAFEELKYLILDADNGGDSQTVETYRETLESLFAAQQRILKALKDYGPASKRLDTPNERRMRLQAR